MSLFEGTLFRLIFQGNQKDTFLLVGFSYFEISEFLLRHVVPRCAMDLHLGGFASAASAASGASAASRSGAGHLWLELVGIPLQRFNLRGYELGFGASQRLPTEF